MRLWQLIRFTSLLNRKPPRSITTLQILEAVDGDTRGTCGELQQTRLLLGIPAANALPEVLNDLVVLRVPAVICVLLPVLDVNVSDTTNQQFKLALVEDID
jgi:hypothetical protein